MGGVVKQTKKFEIRGEVRVKEKRDEIKCGVTTKKPNAGHIQRKQME